MKPEFLIERYRRLSLRAKFTVHIGISITVLFAALIPSAAYLQERAALEQAQQRGLGLTRVFAYSSVQAVVADDFLIMRHVVNSIASDPDVLYAMILSPDGRALLHSSMRESGGTYTDPVSLRAAQADRPLIQEVRLGQARAYDFAVPIYVMNERRAVARVGISIERELAAIAQTRNTILALGVVALAAGGVLAAWQARTVTRPVGALVRGAKEISRGNLTHRIGVGGGDELGELAFAFNRMTESLHALMETSRELSSTLDPAAVLRSVAGRALDLAKADSAAIALVERDTQLARVKVVLGAQTDRLQDLVVTPGRGLGGAVLARRTAIVTSNYLEDPGFTHDVSYDEVCRREGIVSAVAVPIILRGEPVGVLWVSCRTSRAFPPEDVDALGRMTHQAAIAIENTRLYADTKLKTARLESLLGVSQAITSTLDPERIVQVVLQAVTDLMDDIVVRLWVAQDGEGLVPMGSSNLRTVDQDAPRSVPPGMGLVGRVAASRAPLVIDDLRNDPRVVRRNLIEREALVSFLGLPLVREDRLLGVLSIVTRTPHRFTEDEINLFASFAQQAAIALENARLYQELKTSHEELLAAQEQLVQKTRMAAIGEIAAAVAHEARNPLGALSNCVQMLRANPHLTGEDVELLGIVQTETQRLNEIVSDFLAFGRPRPPHHQEVDFHELLEATLTLLRRDDRCPASIRFVMKFDPTLGALYADRDQLRQVFWNLFLNAVQAMGAGGELRVETWHRGDRAEILVQDTGPGIPPALLPRVFEPFVTTKAAGTGLGLAIVRRIVDDHGGLIRVDSAPGVGTSFVLSLPLHSREAR